MARDDDGQRVGGARGADGPHGLGAARQLGDGGIRSGAAVADGGQAVQDGGPEAGRQLPVEGQVEGLAAAFEVLAELAGGEVEPGGARAGRAG